MKRKVLHQIAKKCDIPPLHLFYFYFKCAHALSFELIGALLGCSSTKIRQGFSNALVGLYEKFVPLYLGAKAWTREKLNAHTPKWIKELFEVPVQNILLLLDGFNVTTQKPTHFRNQKKLYSGKQHNNSIVAHGICAADGSFIDIPPIFASNGHNNDETIFNATTDELYETFHEQI